MKKLISKKLTDTLFRSDLNQSDALVKSDK